MFTVCGRTDKIYSTIYLQVVDQGPRTGLKLMKEKALNCAGQHMQETCCLFGILMRIVLEFVCG